MTVTLTAAGCEPSELRTSAGLTRFAVTNHGPHVGSFTVLAGDRAVGRVDGVPSGATASLALRLAKGSYRTACDAGSSAGGGTLVVGTAAASPQLGQATDLLAATTTYRAYLRVQVGQLRAEATALRDDLSSGDLAGARTSYLAARQTYSRVKVAARNFGNALLPGVTDLDAAIDPDASTAGTGLSRLADGLWSGRTDGLAAVAATLVADVDLLADRFASMHLDAVSMAAGTSDQLGGLVDRELAARSGADAQLGLVDSQGVVEGSEAVMASLGTPLRRRDPELATTVSSRLAGLERRLAGLRQPSGFPPVEAIASGSRRQLAIDIDAAADAWSQVAGALTRPEGA